MSDRKDPFFIDFTVDANKLAQGVDFDNCDTDDVALLDRRRFEMQAAIADWMEGMERERLAGHD